MRHRTNYPQFSSRNKGSLSLEAFCLTAYSPTRLATGLKKAHRTEFYRDLSLTDYAKEANPANDPMDSKSRAATWKKNRRQVRR